MVCFWLQVGECNIQFRFHVQLQNYTNEFNLKYNPEKNSTPYCCCANRNICFTSINDSNLDYSSCPFQCQLRFTLCAALTSPSEMSEAEPSTLAPYCFESDVNTGFPFYIFGGLSPSSSFFPDQNKFPHFQFPFELHSPNVSTHI